MVATVKNTVKLVQGTRPYVGQEAVSPNAGAYPPRMVHRSEGRATRLLGSPREAGRVLAGGLEGLGEGGEVPLQEGTERRPEPEVLRGAASPPIRRFIYSR